MSFEAALAVATIIIVTSVIGLTALVSNRARRAQEEELARVASARGWKFTAVNEKGYRIQRYEGTTDGIPWVAESLQHRAGGHEKSRRRHISRWHAMFSPGIHAPILAMGVAKGKEVPTFDVAEGDSVIAKVAQKAAGFALDKAIDSHFGSGPGKDVNAAAMHRVDGQRIPGFIVMASDKEEGARVLADGLERGLIDAASNPLSVLSQQDRPWILLRPDAISLARMKPFKNVTELEGFVRAGTMLARGFKFGRS
jgi:hypothetical protein